MADLIMALHRRYEAAYAEYNIIDEEEIKLEQRDLERVNLTHARNMSQRETDLLRLAILHQVPETWPEALVFAFHLQILLEMSLGAPEPDDQVSLTLGMETLFNFMCCKVEQDHEELGPQFQSSANIAFTEVRRRHGELD